MPKNGDVYNPVTDSFGPAPLKPAGTPEGISQRYQLRAEAGLANMVAENRRLPSKLAMRFALSVAAGTAICIGGIALIDHLMKLP